MRYSLYAWNQPQPQPFRGYSPRYWSAGQQAGSVGDLLAFCDTRPGDMCFAAILRGQRPWILIDHLKRRATFNEPHFRNWFILRGKRPFARFNDELNH